jgi:hypothetical protein
MYNVLPYGDHRMLHSMHACTFTCAQAMGLASGSNAAAPVQQVVAANGQLSDAQRGVVVTTIRECLDELQDTFIPINELQVGPQGSGVEGGTQGSGSGLQRG